MANQNGPLIDRPIFALGIVLLVAIVLILLDEGVGNSWLSWAYW